MAGKEVAKKENTAVGSYDYGDHAHEGFEGTTINDLSIPFINVLQSNSPEVEEQTIEGAKAGDLLNSVTGEILQQPVIVVPVYKEAAVVEWVPRAKGGGLVDRHELDSEIFKEAIRKNGGSRIPPKDADGRRMPFKSPDGNDLVETYYVYCLILDEEGKESEGYCVLSFSSTKIKIHKDWMTSMYTIKGRPPMYANRVKVSTQKQIQQSSGKSFYNYYIGPMERTWREGLINPQEQAGLLEEARQFKQMIESGLARAAFETVTNDEDSSSAGSATAGEDDMPF